MRENEERVLKRDWERRRGCDAQREGENDGERALLT